MNIKWEVWTIGDGGCPCGEAEWKGFRFRIHCWRVGLCCPFSGVHTQGYPKGQKEKALRLARMIAGKIEKSWTTEVTVSERPYGDSHPLKEEAC
jgi:hypothetical protein